MKLKDVSIGEAKKSTDILTRAFEDDKGMKTLFFPGEPRYKQKLIRWFIATLKMQIRNKQLVWGVYNKEDLIGLAIISNVLFKPSVISIAKWLLSILWYCGFNTVRQTILHDQARRKYFTSKHQFILEFIAVDLEFQGQGAGRMLLNELQKHSAQNNQSIWLETTKTKNIKIFEKSGFNLIGSKQESDVEYYMMTNDTGGI